MPLFNVTYRDSVSVHRFQNTNPAGTPGSVPVASATRRLDGREVGGIYTLAVSGRSGSTGNITVTSSIGSDNAQHNRVVACVFDGTTVHTDLLRGWDIVLSAGAADGHSAVVYDGYWSGTASAGNPIGLTLIETAGYAGLVFTGGQGAGADHCRADFCVTNVSGKTAHACYLVLRPGFAYKPTAGSGLRIVDVTGLALATLDTAPGRKVLPYAITFANYNAGANTIDVLFDGATRNCVDLSTGNARTTAALPRDEAKRFRLTWASLVDTDVVVASDASASDTGELRVYPLSYFEITTNDGVSAVARPSDEGGALWGQTPVGLTETPGTPRQLANNGSAYVSVKAKVPAGADWWQNPFLCQLRVQAALAAPTGA